MITLLTGAPGAGKTALAVDMITEANAKGRAVFVHGLDGLKSAHVQLDEPNRWHELVPDGALIVIDEVQAVWRPARAGSKVADDVAALETHRHRGIDFVVTTQHPSLLHSNVRRLVGRHMHIQDFGFLGRRVYEWSEVSDSLNKSKALVSRRYKLPKKSFAQYTSASIHVKPNRGLPRALVVALVAVPLTAVLLGMGYQRVMAKGKPAEPEKAAHAMPTKEAAREQPAAPPSTPDLVPTSLVEQVIAPKFAGCISMGNRCECIDTEGFSKEVERAFCVQTAARSGVGVPYQLEGPKEGPPKPASPPQAGQPQETQVSGLAGLRGHAAEVRAVPQW